MQNEQNNLFTLNGTTYDITQLPPEGQKLVGLLKAAQDELNRLDIRRELFQSSQQHLLSLLKPILVHATTPTDTGAAKVFGKASPNIPPTPVTPPDGQPAPFPENLPETFRARP